jgi:carboxyl-terminal processing protease
MKNSQRSSKFAIFISLIRICFSVGFLLTFTFSVRTQSVSSALNLKEDRNVYQLILRTIKKDLKEKYFDPNLKGIDIEANAKKASELIEKAQSPNEMDDIIARFLYPLDDSHLGFHPPRKTTSIEYGWEMMFIGDKAFVTTVQADSDAYKKGLRVGDQIYMVNDYVLTRKDFPLFRYHFNILRPQLTLSVLLIKPSGNKYKVQLNSKVTQESVFLPSSRELYLEEERDYNELTNQLSSDEISGLFIWKMPTFYLSLIKLDKMMDKVKKANALILDLRGNPGGSARIMWQFASYFVGEETKFAEIKDREGSTTVLLKPKSKNFYQGKIVILIDSESASAAEAFSRFMQIEKKATIIGDQSAGAVMQSSSFVHTYGILPGLVYGISITTADVLMQDGKHLEKVGVTPDEKILPTAKDLANKRDPVLARAAELLGFKLSPEDAGLIFEEKKK